MNTEREHTVSSILGEEAVKSESIEYFVRRIDLNASLTIDQQNELARHLGSLREMSMDGLYALSKKLYVKADFDAFDSFDCQE